MLERCPESISPRNDTAGMTPRNRPHEIGLPREVERNLEPVAVGGARRPQRCRSSSTTRSAGEFGVSAKPATMSTSLVCGTPARSKTRSRRPVAPFRRHLRRAGPAAGRLRGRLDERSSRTALRYSTFLSAWMRPSRRWSCATSATSQTTTGLIGNTRKKCSPRATSTIGCARVVMALNSRDPELICLIREKTGFLRHKRRVMDCRRMAATHGDGRQLRLIPPALVRAGTPRKASYDNPYE